MSLTATKKDYTIAVAQKLGITLSQAHDIVTEIFDAMRTHLEQGFEIKFNNFGRIVFRFRAAHPGHNVSTPHQPSIVPARIHLGFVPSLKLKTLTTKENNELFTLPPLL